jgi:microsomal dipeptidase-like Zn-dependent dipeptidase
VQRAILPVLIGIAAFTTIGPAERNHSESVSQRADRLWNTSPVFVSHTHVDPDDPAGSVEELVRAGVTTAVFDLTIDDGDYRSRAPGYQRIEQWDSHWDERFQFRLEKLKELEKAHKLTIVRHMRDIPASPQAVQRTRRSHSIALVIGSEGSNQFEGIRQLTAGDVPTRDAAAKSGTLQSIRDLRQQGWLSTALVHTETDSGHRLLQPQGGNLNDYGRFVASALGNNHILIDAPHLSAPFRQEILAIADLTDSPVMVSHDNPAAIVQDDRAVAIHLIRSGHCTGLIGAHSYRDYISPDLAHYAASIDAGRRALNKLRLPNGKNVDGSRHLALGIDWFAFQGMDLHSWAGRAPNEPLKNIVAILIRPPFNYTDSQVRAILGGNMIRVMSAALKEDMTTHLDSCR